jgi:acetoin utilization deacetylase AcuC-like enzyme
MIMSGVDWISRHYDSNCAEKEHLLRAHTPEYIERVYSTAPQEGEGFAILDGDTGMNTHTLEAALHAAGAGVMGVDLVMTGTHKHAFCAIRPPGHHAARAQAAGFCIFNNVAIAATYAIDVYGLERVAIIDFDVHHGDGTEDIVKNDPRILFCSSFQHPFYPFSGADTNLPNIKNLPLPSGTGGAAWREAVEASWLPALREFKPELVLISAGFDSHMEDDMGGFNLVERDYVWITKELCQIAKEFSEGRVVSILEGGYELSPLGRSATLHIKELAEFH